MILSHNIESTSQFHYPTRVNIILDGPKPGRIRCSIQLLGSRACNGIIRVRREAILEEAFLHRDLLNVRNGRLCGVVPEVVIRSQVPGAEQAYLRLGYGCQRVSTFTTCNMRLGDRRGGYVLPE